MYCAGATADGVNTYNVVDVQTAPGVRIPDITLERNVYTTSSCGLCGKASLDAVRTTTRHPIADSPPLLVTPELLAGLPDRLRASQRVFDRTGACTRRPCSTRRGNCWTSGRTWAGTTRSTSWSAVPCRAGTCRCPGPS